MRRRPIGVTRFGVVVLAVLASLFTGITLYTLVIRPGFLPLELAVIPVTMAFCLGALFFHALRLMRRHRDNGNNPEAR